MSVALVAKCIVNFYVAIHFVALSHRLSTIKMHDYPKIKDGA